MSGYIHFSWHASPPPMGRRQEAGERSPTRQKISVFDKREQTKLAFYAERIRRLD